MFNIKWFNLHYLNKTKHMKKVLQPKSFGFAPGTLVRAGLTKKNLLSGSMKALLLALIIFTAPFQVNSQNFAVIGTGNGSNSSTGYPAPFGNWYWGAKHQMFVTAAELTAAGITPGAMISSIGLNVVSVNSGPTHQGFTFRVFTTLSADPVVSAYLNTVPIAVTTPSNVPPTTGWIMIPFVTPFNWNGTDNLVVETCFNNSSYIQNFSTEWQSNLGGSAVKTRFNYQDNATACTAPQFETTSTTTRPLIRMEWVPGVPCSGTPGANTIAITPTSAICPNSSAQLGFVNSYTVGGITYQWLMSTTSAFGPFSVVPNASLSSITTPTLNQPTYFTAIVTCTNSNGTVQATAGQVLVQNTTTNNVYYFEGFEGIAGSNKLPNCSWAASNLPQVCQTYTSVQNQNRSPRTGQNFASFAFSPAGTNYFWTNQIWMEAGVTYSVNMYYKTEYYGYPNWQLNILLNATQQAPGSSTIASSGGPGSAASVGYKLLNNSFTVATSGFYYVGIQASSNATGTGFLSWDDLEIMVPCQLNPVAVTINAPSTTICQGGTVNLSASGADSYLWSNGSTNAAISVSPLYNTVYTVIGTNAASGCTVATSQQVIVNESPVVSALTFDPEICVGDATTLQAFGADTYLWSNNASGAIVSVSPNSTSTYTVTGTNAAGCSGTALVTITVNPLPTIQVNTSNNNNLACAEDVTTLQGTGALTFQWISASSMLIGNPVNVSPNFSTTYTVIGTDAKGCEGVASYQLNVTECVGLNEVSTTQSGIKLYPNPNQGQFVVEFQNTTANSVEVSDLTGRILLSENAKSAKISVDLGNFANGVYYVKVNSGEKAEVIKVVKH